MEEGQGPRLNSDSLSVECVYFAGTAFLISTGL